MQFCFSTKFIMLKIFFSFTEQHKMLNKTKIVFAQNPKTLNESYRQWVTASISDLGSDDFSFSLSFETVNHKQAQSLSQYSMSQWLTKGSIYHYYYHWIGSYLHTSYQRKAPAGACPDLPKNGKWWVGFVLVCLFTALLQLSDAAKECSEIKSWTEMITRPTQTRFK